ANWGGSQYVREIGTYLPDQWQHVAVSNVGGILQVYHNGNVTTYPFVSGSIAYLDDTIFIGGNDNEMPQVFHGAIDEVRYWSSFRSENQILVNDTLQLTGNEPNLAGYWKFDEENVNYSVDSVRTNASGVQPATFGPTSFADTNLASRSPRWVVGPTQISGYNNVPLGREPGLPKVVPARPETDLNQIHAASSDRWRDEDAILPSLIGNGGNEETLRGNPISDWVDPTGNWTTADLPDANPDLDFDPDPLEGSKYFHYEFPAGEVVGEISQDIDLAAFSDAINAQEQSFLLSTYYMTVQTGGDDVNVQVRVQFLDGSLQQIAPEYKSAELRSQAEWALFTQSLMPPKFTKNLRIILRINNDLPTRNAGYFDNVNLSAIGDGKFYQFDVDVRSLPEGQRLSLDQLRFFDYADAGGVTQYAVFTSLDDFASPIAVGNANVGQYGRTEIDLGQALACLSRDEETITFRIQGLGDNRPWRVDDVGLSGVVHDVNSSPYGACPVAVDDAIDINGSVSTPVDGLLNDVGTGLTIVGSDPMLEVNERLSLDGLGILRRTSSGFNFQPYANQFGQARFRYQVQNSSGLTDVGEVTFNVQPAAQRVMYLPLDGDANDASGFGNHGNLVNISSSNFFPGPVGDALQLDGVNQYVNVLPTSLPGAGDDFTVATWVRIADWDNTEGIVAAFSENGIRWNMGVSNPANAMLVRADFGSNQRFNVPVTGLPDGEFVHFAAVFTATGGVEQVYVNGSPVSESGSAFFNYNDVGWFTLGRRVISGSNARYLNGALDEFVIFDQALDADAVRTLWNGGRSVHLTMDETAGTSALDSSPNGNDGTLIGTSKFASDFPGVFGRAIDLRGVNGRVSIANNANLPVPGDTFTVASWVRVDDWDAPSGIIASYQFNGLRWNIGLKGSEGSLFVGAEFGANRMAAFDVTQLPDGQFVHMAVVYSAIAGVENVYFNGEPVFESYDAAFLFTNGGSFTLGSRTRNGVTSVYLDGILDDFALFDRRLSLTELQQVIAQGAGSLVSGGPAGGVAASAASSAEASTAAIEAVFAGPLLAVEEDDLVAQPLSLQVNDRKVEHFNHVRRPLLAEARARRSVRSRSIERLHRVASERKGFGAELDYERLAGRIFAEDSWDDTRD
ncbi:MAG: LamG-like jellyroll fold domain-containing protein, partial [Pirellulales bacterium]